MEFISGPNQGVIVISIVLCTLSLLLAFLAIVITGRGKNSPQIILDGVIILGLASVTIPIFLLLIGVYQASIAVQASGEISMSLVWDGIARNLPMIIVGFITFHISVIIWFIARRVSPRKSEQ